MLWRGGRFTPEPIEDEPPCDAIAFVIPMTIPGETLRGSAAAVAHERGEIRPILGAMAREDVGEGRILRFAEGQSDHARTGIAPPGRLHDMVQDREPLLLIVPPLFRGRAEPVLDGGQNT